MQVYVNDGKSSNCGDSACTTWGTTVTGGSGSGVPSDDPDVRAALDDAAMRANTVVAAVYNRSQRPVLAAPLTVPFDIDVSAWSRVWT